MRRAHLARLAALAALYFVVARLGLTLDAVSGFAALVWPATGLALAALYLYGLGLWPAVWVGAAVVNFVTGAPLAVACGIATGNTLEAVTGVWLLRRVGFRPSLARVTDVLALAFLVGATCMISATVGVTALYLGGLVTAGAVRATWHAWWLGDLVAALVLAPALLAWGCPPRPAWPSGRRALEAAALAALALATAAFVFATDLPPFALHHTYLVVAPLLWVALRLGVRSVTLAIFGVSAVAIAGTALGRGPLTGPSLHDSLETLQAFMAVVAVTILTLHAVSAERADALERERRARAAGLLAEGRLTLLAGASAVVNAHLDAGALERLAALLTEGFADCCVIDVAGDDGALRRAAVGVADPARREAARALDGAAPPLAVAEVLRQRRTVAETLAPGALAARVPDRGLRALLEELGVASALCVPMVASGQASGVISLFRADRARPFADGDVVLAEDIARRTALAANAGRALRRTEEARRLLDEADRRKSEFLAMLSHELRNPLAPIRSSVFILDRAPPGGEGWRRALAIIDRQVDHLARLVDELLDVTRIVRGKIQLQSAPLALGALVRLVAEDHRGVFERQGVALEVDVADDELGLEGDAVRLAQMLGNLLQNAAKFTPLGGRATVSLRRAADGRAEIRVRDTGTGISPETLARLFEPFVQADRTLERSSGGLGLGLALVKGIAELHGGTVEARSEGPGRGAEFTVRLPLSARPAPAAPAPHPGPTSRGRVLVIEDNVDAAESLRLALELGGHEVEVAFTGPDGIARACRMHPDAILCDIGLPGMDGYEVARRLRADPALGAVRLLAVSGYARPEDVERSRRAGFDGHLAKPLSIETLEERLAAPTIH